MTKKTNVAIADDKSPFAENLRMFLSKRGYKARWFAYDDELLAWVRQHDAPGVVLFDAIPAINRFQALKALKASYPRAETIVMSAVGQHSREVDGERPDGLRYVSKPETFETFEGSALDAAAAGGLVGRPGESRRRRLHLGNWRSNAVDRANDRSDCGQ
jgi:DNA-binding NtrC family response regulator